MKDAFAINASQVDQAVRSPEATAAARRKSRTSQWIAKKSAEALYTVLDLDEDNTRLLEFGCGQGVLAMQLCQHVASYTGIDASSGAAARLNERFIHQGLEPGEAKAYSFDVHHSNQEGQASIVDIEPVDCIVASMVHHHLSDPASTTQLLIHRYLKPGGKIAIIDLVHDSVNDSLFNPNSTPAPNPSRQGHDPSHQGHVRSDGVCWHGGFSQHHATSWLTLAGCVDIAYEEPFSLTRSLSHPDPSQPNQPRLFTFFLLSATKPLFPLS